MSEKPLRRAEKPTFYFIGVTTGKSSIMRVFPAWAKYLRLGDCVLQGVDFRRHDDPESYRRAVSFIKRDPLSIGALITTHKIDLLAASRELFDELDRYARLTGEISAISKRGGRLVGRAMDPVSSGLALEAFLPKNYWRRSGAEVFVIGAGGSATAITSYLLDSGRGRNRPARITVSNRSTPRLREIERVHEQIGEDTARRYVHAPKPGDNDEVVNRLPDQSMVINATGLGKDAPGSPLTDEARFPRNGIAWEFNYRGELEFLRQARAQSRERNLMVQDGWMYFIHGWTRVLAEVFDVDIPAEGKVFEELSRIAAELR
ncbi:MAG: shikimate dehydrogenase [Spirochaetales bacterium]|nr:shikimate dehydrogenase [Spirochaetales bacterium]